jgi:ornithine--oxo-acid transaminase
MSDSIGTHEALGEATEALIELEEEWGAENYKPLDVVLTRGEGVWVYDAEGKRYLDCLSSYSALNLGHCHPRIRRAMIEQASKLTLTSRAFHNDQLPAFCEELAQLTGMDTVLPMNTGVEAVETAIKAARRWGYTHKKIPDGRAEIIAFENNFHGRTIAVVGFSSEPAYRAGFGPFAPGFRVIPFGDSEALRAAITPNTCAVLLEPIQCEAGVIIPPAGFLRDVRKICDDADVLMMADEIQTGLGRTGGVFACGHEDVQPDAYLLGKALGGGFYPVSAVAARHDMLAVFDPGSHGSTFGGNPLACAIGREALRVMADERLPEKSTELGAWFLSRLREIKSPSVLDIRGAGLMIGVELNVQARPYCEALADRGVLCKETHGRVIRLAPPLIITKSELEIVLTELKAVLS